jgi:hypothetical protein
MRALLPIILAAVLATPAHADDDEYDWPHVVVIPVECADFTVIPGGATSPVAWDRVLSFAACIQDASVLQVTTAEEVDALTEQLQLAMAPALHFYIAAMEEAPRPAKLRAAYYIALGQLTLVVRARASLAGAGPELRARLEPFLVSHARLAWEYFRVIARAPIDTRDPVVKRLVESARWHASVIRDAWRFHQTEMDGPRLASPL